MVFWKTECGCSSYICNCDLIMLVEIEATKVVCGWDSIQLRKCKPFKICPSNRTILSNNRNKTLLGSNPRELCHWLICGMRVTFIVPWERNIWHSPLCYICYWPGKESGTTGRWYHFKRQGWGEQGRATQDMGEGWAGVEREEKLLQLWRGQLAKRRNGQ